MKSLYLLSICFLSLTLTAFVSTDINYNKFYGTYSVCQADNYPVSLTIKADKTFTYRDLTNVDKLIQITGKWTTEKETIFLKDDNGTTNFHNKWKLDLKNNHLSSRKGLSFYSLGNVEKCK